MWPALPGILPSGVNRDLGIYQPTGGLRSSEFTSTEIEVSTTVLAACRRANDVREFSVHGQAISLFV
jgi:hypothetical protein